MNKKRLRYFNKFVLFYPGLIICFMLIFFYSGLIFSALFPFLITTEEPRVGMFTEAVNDFTHRYTHFYVYVHLFLLTVTAIFVKYLMIKENEKIKHPKLCFALSVTAIIMNLHFLLYYHL
ncbi:MAG: hypothetical protein FWD48_05450 [Oscillospiraceae bacterium]|nr:hypothetical protein [Oscillospiraceae bacterium]